MRKYGWILLLAAALFLITGCEKPDVWEMNDWYIQLSRYKDSELRAFSLYLKVNEQEKVEKICDYYMEKFAEPERFLQIDFFDNRSFTPDYSKGVEVNEYQAQHRVAQFYYDPFRDLQRLEFFR